MIKRNRKPQSNFDDDPDDEELDDLTIASNASARFATDSTVKSVRRAMQTELNRKKNKKRDESDSDGEAPPNKRRDAITKLTSSDGSFTGEVEYSAEMLQELEAEQKARKDDIVGFEPFNLKEERDTGHFDDNGDYVRSRRTTDEDKKVSDAWLDEVDELEKGNQTSNTMNSSGSEGIRLNKQKAIESREKRQQEMQKVAQVPASEHLKVLIDNLQPQETVLQALARVGNTKTETSKPTLALGRAHRKLLKAKSKEQETTSRITQDKELLSKITEAANALLLSGYPNVYQSTSRTLQVELDECEESNEVHKNSMKLNNSETQPTAISSQQQSTQQPHVGQTNVPKWVYKLRGSETQHGPFGGDLMEQWRRQGFFKGDKSAWVKQVIEPANGTTAAEAMNDLSSDDGEDESSEWQDSNNVDFLKP